MVRCNNCFSYFESEEDLTRILITTVDDEEVGEIYNNQEFREGEDQEVVNGCPHCLTDKFLMDIDLSCLTDEIVESIWESLTDVIFDETELGEQVLAGDWFIFKKGTGRDSEIWKWFDDNYSHGVAVLLNGKEVEE